MKKLKNFLLIFCIISILGTNLLSQIPRVILSAQDTIRVIPKEIDDVLTNPGIGFRSI